MRRILSLLVEIAGGRQGLCCQGLAVGTTTASPLDALALASSGYFDRLDLLLGHPKFVGWVEGRNPTIDRPNRHCIKTALMEILERIRIAKRNN